MSEKESILKEIRPQKNQHAFFTSIDYGAPYHIVTNEIKYITSNDEVLLVCGIANPKPLKNYLGEKTATYYQMDYRDHHVFRIDDLKEIRKRFEKINALNKFIITTEKDAVRLIKFNEELQSIPLYVLPVKHKFLFDEGKKFDKCIIDFIENFKLDIKEEKEN